MSEHSKLGTLIIPDITGYTEFISSVDIDHGRHIIAELLEGVIQGNRLGLTLSEVEGDALLFYRQGPPPTLEEVLAQAQTWVEDFHTRLKQLTLNIYCACGSFQHVGNLSLKIVAHHGELGRFRIGGQDKLIGKDVVLVHRLLKNSLDLREYLLLSGELLDAMEVPEGEESVIRRYRETYPVFGAVDVGVADLSSMVAALPLPEEPWMNPPTTDDFVMGEAILATPMERAVWAVSDMDANVLWIEGLREIIHDSSRPMGKGHQHVCILDGQELEHEVMGIKGSGDEFVLSFKIKPPRLFLKAFYKTFVLTQEQDRVRMQYFIYYTRVPLMGRLFERFVLPKIRMGIDESLRNLKDLLEKESVPKSSVA